MAERSLGAAWLAGDEKAQRWLPGPGIPIGRRRERAQAAAAQPCLALEALRAEPANQRPAACDGLERLARGAAAVVTGQQAAFLTGPLYTLHKALSAVAVADALESETGVLHVPVFWVQDEDHDLLEMGSAAWRCPEGWRRAGLGDGPGVEARVPVGDLTIPPSLVEAAACACPGFPGAAFADELERFVAPWLRTETSWSDAFVASMLVLVGETRLLFLRGRSPELAHAAKPVLERSLMRAPELESALLRRSAELAQAGFREQVAVRPGTTLAFFHPQGRGGPRHRLELGPKGYRHPGCEHPWSLDALLEVLEAEPSRFGSSALLRPLVQDCLLPVTAQLVGPGEAAYLAQVAAIREVMEAPSPLVIPRGQATWVEPEVDRRLRALGMSAGEALTSGGQILASRAGFDPSELRAELLEPCLRRIAALELPPGLERARSKTEASVGINLGRLIGRMTRAAAEADAVGARRLAEVELALRPEGIPQERCEAPVGLLARYGSATLVRRFLEAYQPFQTSMLELRP